MNLYWLFYSCGTIMGKRMLEKDYSIVNSSEIDKRYAIIESMLQDNFINVWV